ncbi:hypothetical protein DXG01_003255 [Tephrocybe rancida]|nr:hypothetical protein DXG01_003255 [Tephrocybe rancida]
MAGAHDIDVEKLGESRRDDHPEPLPNKAPAKPRDAMKFVRARGTQQRECSQELTILLNFAVAIFTPQMISILNTCCPIFPHIFPHILALTFALLFTGSSMGTAQYVYMTLVLLHSDETLTMSTEEFLECMPVYLADISELVSSLTVLYSILSSAPYVIIPYALIEIVIASAFTMLVYCRRP